MPLEALRSSEAEKRLRYCLDHGSVILGKHFREELRNEGLIFAAAEQVLITGRIYDPPELDVRSREWKYRIEGKEPDGKWLAIVFCFKSTETAFLITIFSITAQTKRS